MIDVGLLATLEMWRSFSSFVDWKSLSCQYISFIFTLISFILWFSWKWSNIWTANFTKFKFDLAFFWILLGSWRLIIRIDIWQYHTWFIWCYSLQQLFLCRFNFVHGFSAANYLIMNLHYLILPVNINRLRRFDLINFALWRSISFQMEIRFSDYIFCAYQIWRSNILLWRIVDYMLSRGDGLISVLTLSLACSWYVARSHFWVRVSLLLFWVISAALRFSHFCILLIRVQRQTGLTCRVWAFRKILGRFLRVVKLGLRRIISTVDLDETCRCRVSHLLVPLVVWCSTAIATVPIFDLFQFVQGTIWLLGINAKRIGRRMLWIEVLGEGLDLVWSLFVLERSLSRQYFFSRLSSLGKMWCVQNSFLVLIFKVSQNLFFVWVALAYLVQFFSSFPVDQAIQIYFIFLAIFYGVCDIIGLDFTFILILVENFSLVLFVFFGDLIPNGRFLLWIFSDFQKVHIGFKYFLSIFLNRNLCIILIMGCPIYLRFFCHFFLVGTFAHAPAIFVLSPTSYLARQFPVFSRLASCQRHETRRQGWFYLFYILDPIFFAEILQLSLDLFDFIVLWLQFPLFLNKSRYHFSLNLFFIFFADSDFLLPLNLIQFHAISSVHVLEPVWVFFVQSGAICSIFIGKFQIFDFLLDWIWIKTCCG